MPAVALHMSRALRLMESPKTVYSALMRDPTHAHSSWPVVTPMQPCPPRAFMPSTIASAACRTRPSLACSQQLTIPFFSFTLEAFAFLPSHAVHRRCLCRIDMQQKVAGSASTTSLAMADPQTLTMRGRLSHSPESGLRLSALKMPTSGLPWTKPPRLLQVASWLASVKH